MNTKTDDMLSPQFFKSTFYSLFEHGLWKALLAVLFSLFSVPLEYVVALPIFWFLDFGAGVFASRRKARQEGRRRWFSEDKMRKQFVKIGIHVWFLTGCIVFANLFDVEKMITFGFGYIIAHEFFWSTTRHLFGDHKAAQIIAYFKNLILRSAGIDLGQITDSEPPENPTPRP